jgi:hypothetical protein
VSQRKLSKIGGRRRLAQRAARGTAGTVACKRCYGRAAAPPGFVLPLASPPAALALVAWLALMVLAASCGQGRQGGAAAAGARRDSGRAMKEVEVQEDPVKTGIEAADAGLAGRVRSRLNGDAQLRRLPIEVDAEAGRVTLWGHVGSAEERAAAEQLARRTPGVTSVVDHIKIAPPR